MTNALLAILFTLLSGYADSQGFVHAAAVWRDGHWSRAHLSRSAIGFAVGVVAIWLAIRFAQAEYRLVPEVITLGWFAVTIVGVAVSSREFGRWRPLDQLIGLAAVGMLAVLVRRTG